MLTISVTLLLLVSSNLVAAALSTILEHRYDNAAPADAAGAIVILCGGIDSGELVDTSLPALAHDTYLRCLRGANLFRSRPLPVVVSGRNCAPAMARFVEAQGVIPQSIWIENDSANTHENAVFSASILRVRGIRQATVITDAKSMLRAELCFRKAEIEVIPSPVELGVFELQICSFIPSWKAVRANGDALHELVGLMWYWRRGWV